MLVAEGKQEDTVASELGIPVEQVREAYERFVKQMNVAVKTTEKFSSVEDELRWLYAEQKKRLRLIRALEDASNLPFPDTKDNVLVLLKILEAIMRLEMRLGLDVERLKSDLLGDV